MTLQRILSSLLITCLLATAMPASAAARINRLEFKEANIKDAARILSTLTGANIAVTKEAGNAQVDLLLQNVDIKHAVEMISRVSGLWYRYNKPNNSYLIMTEKQYQDDIVVYRNDTIRSFTLKHQNVKATALTIKNLYGDRVILTLQEDLDDFVGIPSGYLQAIAEQTSSASNSNSNNKNRVTITNINSNNQGKANSSYSASNKGDITSVQRTEHTSALVNQEIDNSQLNITQLRQINDGRIDADGQGKKLGIKTPIFIATNRIHNLMFVRTSDERAMHEIEELIATSDKPTPQVLLETKILRISQGNNYTQDFDLSFNDALNITGARYSNGSTLNDILNGKATVELEDGTSVSNVGRILEQLTNGSVSLAGFNAATGGFYEFYSRYINAKITLLEERNLAEIIAKPILLASNNRPSRLFIGEDQVVATGLDGGSTTTTNNGNTSTSSSTDTQLETEVRKIGNTLALLPSVNDDGTVTIDILQSTSELKKAGMDFPFYNPRTGKIESVKLDTVEESTLKTIVVAKNGNTIALGGMINQVNRDEKSAVPILGNIPILGNMFKNETTVASDAQYVLLITPHIIATPKEAREKTREIAELDYNLHDESTAEPSPTPKASTINKPMHRQPLTTEELIQLNRYAAARLKGKQVHLPGIQTLSLPDRPFKLPNQPLQGIPVVGYKLKNHYLTVIKISNTTNKVQPLTVNRIPGAWLSIARSQTHITPHSNGYLYFVSRQPFLDQISDTFHL